MVNSHERTDCSAAESARAQGFMPSDWCRWWLRSGEQRGSPGDV